MKASAVFGTIKRVRNLVSRETLTTIYKALIQPYSHPTILYGAA